MSFATTKSQRKVTPYLVELVADTEADIEFLPDHYAAGSTCTIVSTSDVYMLNTQKQWIKQKVNAGGSATVQGSLATEADIDNLFR